MKKLLQLSLLALSAITTLHAQTKHHFRFKDHRTYGSAPAAKTTAFNASRCVGMVYAEYDGTSSYNPADSQVFKYSGARGGVITDIMRYDSSMSLSNSGSSYDPTGRSYQTFDSHNNILTSLDQQYDMSSSSFVNSSRATRTYDANDNMLTEINEYWDASSSAWVNSYKMINTFTAPHLLTTSTMMNWMSGTWNNSNYDTFTYNSYNNQVTRIGKQWNSSTSAWELSAKDTSIYDGSQNLTSVTYQQWMTSTSMWENYGREIQSNYIAPKCPQIYIWQNWDASGSAFENSVKDSIIYNTYNQPTFAYERNWDGSAWPLDNTSARITLYYELYTTKVSDVNNSTTAVNIYPNPASGIVNIDFDLTETNNTTLSLLDVTGRTIRTTGNTELKEGTNKVQYNVTGLAPGVYFLHLTNDKTNITKSIVIGG